MAKCRKYLVSGGLGLCFLVLLISCKGGEIGKTKVSLSEVACKPEDVEGVRPFIAYAEYTAVPSDMPFADQVEQYYGVGMREIALTYTDAFCSLFLLVDEAAAANLFAELCQSAPTNFYVEPYEATPIGEATCVYKSLALTLIYFRQGRVVVSVWEDLGGSDVYTWATAVNGRLEDK